MNSATRQCFLDLRRVGCFPRTFAAPLRPTFQQVISFPDLLKKISDLLWRQASQESFDCLGAVSSRSIPFATSCAMAHHVPLLSIDQDQVVGVIQPHAKVALIEGIIEDPESLLSTLRTLQEAGLVVGPVISLLVTPQATTILSKEGFSLHPVADWAETLQLLSS